MRKIRLFFPFTLCFILSFCSCNKDDETLYDNNGVAIKLPHLWNTSISDNQSELSEVIIKSPTIYGEVNVLVGSNKEMNRAILSINSNDGRVNWEWNDVLTLLYNENYKDPIYIPRVTYYQYNDLFFFNYSTSSYCVDLSTGKTAWKYKSFRSRRSVNSGLDNTYFTSGTTYDPRGEEKIYFGNLESSAEEELFLEPEYTKVDNPVGQNFGIITYLTPFKNGNDSFIAFGLENPYTDFTTKEGMGASELNLYNITQSKYEYKKVVINPDRETRFIGDLFYQAPNLYFQSSNYIHGYEAMTGIELWRTYIGSSPLTSATLLADNKLFSACEDRFLYCVDALTGSLLWKEQNTGTCSELSYLNGILYYLGGGDGLLHAVDAETGKHLWKLQSPDLGTNSGAWFYGVCVAVPGKNGAKGVVVGTTGLNAYGYEAIR